MMASGFFSFSQPINQTSYTFVSGITMQSYSLHIEEDKRPETREEKLGRLHDLRKACQQLEKELETNDNDSFELRGTL